MAFWAGSASAQSATGSDPSQTPSDQAQAGGGASGSNPNLDEIVVSAQAIQGPQAAPSQGSLLATEPQSIISGQYI